MDRLYVQTSLGTVPLVGLIHAGAPRPSLFTVGGAFPPADYKHDLLEKFAGANILVLNLPGMHSPVLADQTIATYSQAFDEVIQTLLPNQPVVAYGISTGALVTLGLKSPNIVRHIAQEPFFDTAELWPFIEDSRARMASAPSRELEEFFDKVFGFFPDRIENRDYWPLLERITVPVEVIHGARPLERREPDAPWPSFLSSAALARLEAMPNVRLHRCLPRSGHHLEYSDKAIKHVEQILLNVLLDVSRAAR